ncbi:MAG: YfcE family phosphodiesterase [Dehalococcoidales bacterium]
MRIGLLSDTHIPWEQKEIPPEVLEAFKGVDLILHGGDIYSHSVLDDLETIAPVLAALGDDDYPSPDPRIQEVHALNLEGQKVWLIHEGPYFPMSPEWLDLWWQNRVTPDNENYGKPDIIISGHAHRTLIERFDGILHISPGSPTLLHYKRGLGTIGILELNGGKADIQIIQLEESPK